LWIGVSPRQQLPPLVRSVEPRGAAYGRSACASATLAHMAATLLAGVIEAQTRNSLLAGDCLIGAARSVAELIRNRRLVGLASDAAGERIPGAALLLFPDLPMVDRSRRLEGLRLLLVAGHISGDAAVSTRAHSARALGAASVEAAILSQWGETIEGCESVWCVGDASPLRAVHPA
jgi:hypothetical protein